jgi:HAD superfamily hydrolase (TIGR01509 family)
MKRDEVDVLLFDLGGVVIDIDFNRVFARWAKHASCDKTLLQERFLNDEAYRRHERGEITANEYFRSLRTSLGIDISNAQFLDGWNAIFVGEMPDISKLLARMASQIALYAFSNSNHAHELCWSKRFASALSHFREVFVSSHIGMRKPDAEAFQFVVKEIGVPAKRIVFFDDTLENIESARICQLQAVHVTSSSDVARVLAAMAD